MSCAHGSTWKLSVFVTDSCTRREAKPISIGPVSVEEPSSDHKHPWREHCGGDFLHTLSTHRTEGRPCHFPWVVGTGVLSTAVPVSTTHVPSGLCFSASSEDWSPVLISGWAPVATSNYEHGLEHSRLFCISSSAPQAGFLEWGSHTGHAHMWKEGGHAPAVLKFPTTVLFLNSS